MKKLSKCIYGPLLILIGVLIGWSSLIVDASTVIDSGTCGTAAVWKLDSEGVLTISGTGAMANYSQLDKAPWYELHIEPYIEANHGEITNIVIEDGITSIGDYEFYQCRHVNSVSIADSVNSIGEKSFAFCESLPEVICSKITKLGDYAFESCKRTETIILYNGFCNGIKIGKFVFKDCSSLKTLKLSSNSFTPSLDYTSFIGCSSLQDVSFSFEIIGGPYCTNGTLYDWSAPISGPVNYQKCAIIKHFQGSTSKSIESGEWVPEIRQFACYDCDNLESATIHDDAKIIGDSAFQDCSNLQTVTMGMRLETIGALAFAECEKLKTITIPGCVSSIGKEAFRGCDELKSVYFRGDVPSVEKEIFSSEMSLTAYYPEDNSSWTAEARQAFGGHITWAPYKPELVSFSDESYGAKIKTETFTFDGNEKTLTVDWVKQRTGTDGKTFRDYPLTPDRNYSVTYEDNINSGTASLLVNGKGEYAGKIIQTFDIQPRVVIDSNPGVYDSKRHYLNITVEGEATLYFSETSPLTFDNYSEVGTKAIPSRTTAGTTKVYYIAVPDKNPSKGSCVSGETQLVIEKAEQKLDAEISSSELTPGDTAEITASSSAGSVSYTSGNPDVLTVNDDGLVTAVSEGSAYITVTSATTTNYKAAEKKILVQVVALEEKSIAECDISEPGECTYSGERIEPELTITDGSYVLRQNKDFTLKYSNNENAGTARITISGKGKYIGSTFRQFTINKADQSIRLKTTVNTVKTGKTVQLELSEDPVGSVTYASSDTGIATVSRSGLVTGISEGTVDIAITAAETDNYLQAQKIISFNVTGEEAEKKSIRDCEIVLSKDSFTYDGKEKKPGVTVRDGAETLTENQDYTLTYPEDMTDAGTLEVTVAGKGNYIDTKVLSYEILTVSSELSFTESSVEKKVGDDPFINILQSKTDGNLTFSSDNKKVAIVDSATGEVTIIGKGSTIISVAASKGRNYKEGSASYELTVSEASVGKLSLDSLSYSFGNTAASFNYPGKYIFDSFIYEMIFGKTTKAAYWRDWDREITGGIWRGNCAGFSSTSALLQDPSSGITVADFDGGADSIRQLNPKSKSSTHNLDITGFIESMQISQHTQLFTSEVSKNRIDTKKHLRKHLRNLNNLYQTIRSETNVGRPVILTLYQSGGHAVLAYDTEEISETESRIYLYDSNWPGTERALTITKDASGNYMDWFYEIGGSYGIWGTDNNNSAISYVPYSVIKEIWATRGRLSENGNMLSINSGSVAIYNGDDKPVATVTQGELSTTADDIHVIDYLSLERAESDKLLLYLPVNVYTFVNLDRSVDEFEVAMANNYLGATATTTADSITMAVDDSCNLNSVFIDAAKGDEYSVTLNSSFSFDDDNVVVKGTGTGEKLEVSQTKGVINIANCNYTSISIDGKELDKYQVVASAGSGGIIDPMGETTLVEGSSQSYKIKANTGYTISDVLVDGKSVGALSSYTFTNVAANHKIEARFNKLKTEFPVQNKGGTTAQIGKTKGSNQINADNVTMTSPAKAKSFKLQIGVLGNAKLTFTSSNKAVKISSDGTVTVPKNFVGESRITIRSGATADYSAAAKTITITVNPTGTVLKKLSAKGTGTFLVTWKKNSKVSGYQICYSTSAKFKKSKIKTIKKNKVVKATLKGKKKKSYYVRIRTYKTVAGKKYYSAWSKKKAVRVR